jgi:putative ABC transport system permease protein
MLKKLFNYSIRALKKQKAYVLINVLGLAIGLSCSLIIAIFIHFELSYDQYNINKDRLYRVILNGKIGGQEVTVTSTASPVGPAMKDEFPEVDNFLRMNSWGGTLIRHNDDRFIEDYFIEADSSFFEFFSIPLLRGNAKTVLNEPHTVVLSESTAQKIFGRADPINELLMIGNDTTYYKITGVYADIPETTHFSANAIGSFMTNRRANDNQWLSNSFSTYVLLHPNTDPGAVNDRFASLVEKHVGPEIVRFIGISIQEFLGQGNKYNFFLQKLTDIHLDPTIEQEFKQANDPKYLWIFGSIAILIIVIASINFMNLSTAQAGKRAKEVGIKKVCGSTRGLLISQFLIETMILSLLALMLTILITELALPYFNRLLGLHLKVGYFNNGYILPGMILGALFIGLIAGSYPAFYLSAFIPYKVLKGLRTGNRKGVTLRRVLVILQFTISITLIIGTLIMFRQINFMLNKDLGFNKEHVLVLREASTIGNKINSFKNELKRIPGVMNVAASTAVPGHSNNNNGYMVKGRPEDSFLLQTNWVDYDYLDTYGMEISSGRFFNQEYATDKEACLINENAVQHYAFDEPFSIRFLNPPEEEEGEMRFMPVIGVVRDFHFESLKSDIGPYLFRFKNEDNNWGYISIKLSPSAGSGTVEEIEHKWESFTNNDPMQYFFMDTDFDRLYKEEKQNAQLAILFTILAIIIASLGLFGLTSFTVQQRTKEIGVRKTFGANLTQIWFLIAREILILIAISTAIAWPFIFWVADNWLQNYHYRINLQVTDFVSGFLIALIIALATISYRTIKTALVNPSESLRYE